MLSRTLPRNHLRQPTIRSISTTTPKQRPRPSLASIALSATHSTRSQRKQQHLLRSLLFLTLAGATATLTNTYLNSTSTPRLIRSSQAEAPPSSSPPSKDDTAATPAPLVFEQSRKQPGLSREENRDLISSQHHQVKRSWENPGVYAWGSNSGLVVAPDKPEDSVIKTPRRIAWFDGKVLRDVRLDRDVGAAIDERGDLVQWGGGYKPALREPETTLRGKDLVTLALSRDRVLALSASGTVYSVPVSAAEQAAGAKPRETSWWIPFWAGKSEIAYRRLEPTDLAYAERVVKIAGGLEHAVLLTSKGRLFSVASASDRYPTRGQLGVAGLTWLTRPEGAFDQPHEITTLRGFQIAGIACGDWHTLALDKEGRVFSWGDNASGQLGFDFNPESSIVDTPSLLPTQRLALALGPGQIPTITSVAAGGNNSYITVDSLRTTPTTTTTGENADRPARPLPRITASAFAFGTGLQGNLANNRWTHIQATPTRIPALSGLFEYDEHTARTVPIRVADFAVGATHAAAVLANITNVSATGTTRGRTETDDDTNWGADVVFWGGNEFFQLGTGKRNNLSTPTYIRPLDMEAETKRAKRSSGAREEHRFHVTPEARVVLPDGRARRVEQRVVCGRGVTGVYSGVCS